MKAITVILMLLIAPTCFAGDFDNPYINNYRIVVKENQSNLIPNPYFEYYNNLTELSQSYQQAKAREQNIANKLVGAVAIGAAGIGAMQLMSGLAEQASDDAAERDMRAYLATFKCDYGAGRNIRGGEKNIRLPVVSDLVPMVMEYKQLAADLKSRKEMLNMTPGIESDIVFDVADANLYDNMSVGKTSGAFTSLSRALMNESGLDGVNWAEQKSSAQRKTKTGAIIGGVGTVAGAVGNLVIHKGDKIEDKK